MAPYSSFLLLAAATPWLVAVASADFDIIAGYTPESDVTAHASLDLDMEELATGADQQTPAGFTEAWKAYNEGGNSVKSDESIRTIRGFSTAAQGKLDSEKWFKIYADYWDSTSYADDFTAAACNGTGDFSDVADVTRAEGCIKGAQYQNVWMYVIHELEDAINDCTNGDLTANDDSVHAWDEGWAFYAGSLEGEDGSGAGYMLHALADKRCINFGTCTGDDDGDDIAGTSAVNEEMLELFKQGLGKLQSSDCNGADSIKDKIVDLMTVPLMQGVLRYTYLADPQAGNRGDKEAAELWAFAAAILPRVHECDQEVSYALKSNTAISSTDAPMSEGYVAMKEKLEGVYSCLGISCSDVGGLLKTSGGYYPDFDPCSDGSSSGLSDGEISVIALVCIGVAGLAVGFFLFRRRKNSKTSQQYAENNLGGFGGTNKPASTL